MRYGKAVERLANASAARGVRMRYEVYQRGDGISSSVWDRSHKDLQWCVAEPDQLFALGNTIALFVKEGDARLFADAANARRAEQPPTREGE